MLNKHMSHAVFIGRDFKVRCSCGWKAECPAANLAGLDYEQRRDYVGMNQHKEMARALAGDQDVSALVDAVAQVDGVLEKASGPMIQR